MGVDENIGVDQSLVAFALGNGEGFANVVESRNPQRAKRD
jgi:hypothetical protein